MYGIGTIATYALAQIPHTCAGPSTFLFAQFSKQIAKSYPIQLFECILFIVRISNRPI
jgi:hypothetical protein